MELREIKRTADWNKVHYIGGFWGRTEKANRKRNPERMTNKPGNPMNYKEVSPVTTIWLRFLLFFQFVQNLKEIKVEITDVFELFSFLNISHSRTSTVQPFRRIRFLSCRSRQRIFRIRNDENNDLSFRMSSLFQTKLALWKKSFVPWIGTMILFVLSEILFSIILSRNS